MRALPLFVRMSDRPCILIGAGEAAAAKRRLLERAGARIVGEGEAAALAIVAEEDEGLAREAVARLRARGILVNAVDRPDLCDFTLPAIVDRNPVLVAMGSDGRSAGLVKALRQRLEALLPADLGERAERLFRARDRLRATFPDATARRRAIDGAFAAGGPLDVLGPAIPDERWIGGADTDASDARLVVLRLGSPDPDDLTLREARLLGGADLIVHRADVPAAILHRARADAARLMADTVPQPLPPGLTLDIMMTP